MAGAGSFTAFFLDCFATDGVPCWGISRERLLCLDDLGNSNAFNRIDGDSKLLDAGDVIHHHEISTDLHHLVSQHFRSIFDEIESVAAIGISKAHWLTSMENSTLNTGMRFIVFEVVIVFEVFLFFFVFSRISPTEIYAQVFDGGHGKDNVD